jgi:hypothetical protein
MIFPTGTSNARVILMYQTSSEKLTIKALQTTSVRCQVENCGIAASFVVFYTKRFVTLAQIAYCSVHVKEVAEQWDGNTTIARDASYAQKVI